MSEYASQELSLELHQLSGWTDTDKYWFYEDSHPDLAEWELATHDMDGKAHPAYDAGYLLRKLPRVYEESSGVRWIIKLEAPYEGVWNAYYSSELQGGTADTPENALCNLAIEMFKAGILPISGRD